MSNLRIPVLIPGDAETLLKTWQGMCDAQDRLASEPEAPVRAPQFREDCEPRSER